VIFNNFEPLVSMTNQGKLAIMKTQHTLCFLGAYLGWSYKFIDKNHNIFLSQYRKIVCKNVSCDMGINLDKHVMEVWYVIYAHAGFPY